MSYEITDEERSKVKQIIDNEWEKLYLDKPDYDRNTENVFISGTDPIKVSYKGGSLLIPDDEENLEALQGFLVDYRQTENFEGAWTRHSSGLDYNREDLKSLVQSDETENQTDLYYIVEELSSEL